MISTSAVLLRRLTLFDDTLKNLRSGLDKGPIIKELDKENHHLKEVNEFLEEASAFFAASRRKSTKNRD